MAAPHSQWLTTIFSEITLIWMMVPPNRKCYTNFTVVNKKLNYKFHFYQIFPIISLLYKAVNLQNRAS